MPDRGDADAARDLLRQAIASRVFPGATVEVGNSRAPIWAEPFGALTFETGAQPVDLATIFDLASLTKPIVTTSLVLRCSESRLLRLDETAAGAFGEWRGADREAVTVSDLLEHASGLSARLLDAPPGGRREFEHEICVMPLEYEPRSKSIYSDLGFILLGFLVEDRAGPMNAQFDQIAAALRPASSTGVGRFLGFSVPRGAHVAPTQPLDEDVRRGRLLAGEVHDSYAAALGGVAGHAGLFGTVAGVGQFARAMLRGALGDRTQPVPFTSRLIDRATTRSSVPGSSRAFGWDTMLPTSSCGTELSPAAFGHVGFTGTSLWIDPVLDRYFVLLTNRACGGGTLDEMREVRRSFHNAVAKLDF